MYKSLALLFLSLQFFACASVQQEKRFKQAYIEEFKLIYFKSCLKNSFGNEEINFLINIDKSSISEPILGSTVYPYIDSLAKITALKDKDQISSEYGERSEGSEGKHVFSECLCTFESKWLEEIALKKYKIDASKSKY